MDNESLPTGMVMPSDGHSSIATARTVAYRSASSPGSPQAAIQLADSRISLETAMSARENVGDRLRHRQARRGRRVQHRHRRALAHRHGFAGVTADSLLKVTETSATGTCHGPTI